jgi:hypothetical protein
VRTHDCRRSGIVAAIVVAAFVAAMARPAEAQTGSRRVAFDTVVGVQDIFAETRDWPTAVVLDPFVGIEIVPHLQAAVRPKVWRLNGEWELVLDQASVQYAFHAGSNWRVEAGRFPSPIGIGMTENRPNINPSVLWWHRPYYMPLPRLGSGAPMVSLVAATYPDGVAVATSSDHWDLRGALVNKAPVAFWQGESGADPKVNTIIGAGITPRQGLRVGVGTAWGDLTDADAGRYRMVNVEGDYSVGYTRVSGEITRDRFEMPGGTHVAWGWTLQAQQTLTPRLYAHARATDIHAPVLAAGLSPRTQTYRSIDTTVGFRVDPEVTLKVGYSAVATWGASQVDHQAGVSLMWSRRWW